MHSKTDTSALPLSIVRNTSVYEYATVQETYATSNTHLSFKAVPYTQTGRSTSESILVVGPSGIGLFLHRARV